MRFAINYSPQAEELWRAGKIQVDLFKCPDWPDLVADVSAMHSVYVHCSLFAGLGLLEDVDFDQLQRWLESTDTLVINTHMAVLETDFAPGRAITTEAIIERVVHDVELLGERFGNDRIIVENIPFPGGIAWKDDLLTEVVDPAVVSEVVQRTGCGLLLDVAHAIRACEGTGRSDIKAYMSAMPVQALRELHVVGIMPERRRARCTPRSLRHDRRRLGNDRVGGQADSRGQLAKAGYHGF